MHMLINSIVYSKNEKDAILRAKDVFNSLIKEDIFDYFCLFNDNWASNRWGKLPLIANIKSNEGKKLVGNGFKNTLDYFKENITYIRNALNQHSDIELMNDSGFKRKAEYLAQNRGYSVYLYDDNGFPIITANHLKNVLTKWKCLYEDENKHSPYKYYEIYVVPADVHA